MASGISKSLYARKADKTDTVLSTTLSRGRLDGPTVGDGSFAFGSDVVASGDYSNAEGFRTVANHMAQRVFGKYNVEDPSSAESDDPGNYVEIVGNGTGYNAKSNARALDWNGNEYIAGDIYINCDDDSTDGTALGARVTNISTNLDNARSDITDISTNLDNARSDITELQSEVSDMKSDFINDAAIDQMVSSIFAAS